MKPLSLHEMSLLEQAFQLYSNNSNVITANEFEQILASLQVAKHPDQIQYIIKSVDHNGDNLIDFGEFVTAMVHHLPHTPPPEPCYEEPDELETSCHASCRHERKRISFYGEEELMQCFQAFDKNHDNRISQVELEEAMKSLGDNLSAREIKAMMEEADVNGDGYIDFYEFKQLIPL